MGQTDRFFVTAPGALSIDPDFTGFGSDLKALRARLRAAGADIDNSFPDYHRRVRRLLGIRSEQAMELRAIVDHFENLVKAHEAVRTATDQLALLTPLIAAAARYDDAVSRHTALSDQRSAISPYVAERLRDLLVGEVETRSTQITGLEARRDGLGRARDALVPERDRLKLERAGVGGDRLRELDMEIPRAGELRDGRAERRRLYSAHLEATGLEPIESEGDFLARVEEVALRRAKLDQERRDFSQRRDPLFEQRAGLRRMRKAANDEIESLQTCRNSLPADLDRLRRRLCLELSIVEGEVPFVGELLDVREEFSDWRGAAERVLRGFALTMLVPQRLYAKVSEWVNENRLNARLVYLRVAERRVRTVHAAHTGLQLADAIAIEAGPFAEFLTAELPRRADHVLAASVAQLQREERAVTREGLVRDRDRHEKGRPAQRLRPTVLGPRARQRAKDRRAAG